MDKRSERLKRLDRGIAKKVRKITYCKGQWGGDLTPVEILRIADSGQIQLNKHDQYFMAEIERARERKNKGESRSQWFYFFLKQSANPTWVSKDEING